MKEETKLRKEKEKLDRKMRAELLRNEAFQRFLRYLHTNAGEVRQHNVWLPGWIVTGCEFFFSEFGGQIKNIVNDNEGKWRLE